MVPLCLAFGRLSNLLRSATEWGMAELKDEDFVFMRIGSSPFASRMFEACVQAGFAPRIVQQVVEVPAALNLVAAGMGVALAPASLALMRQDVLHTCRLDAASAKPGSMKGAKGQRAKDSGASGLRGLSGLSGLSGLNGDVYVLWRTDDGAPAVAEFRKLLLDWAQGQPTTPA